MALHYVWESGSRNHGPSTLHPLQTESRAAWPLIENNYKKEVCICVWVCLCACKRLLNKDTRTLFSPTYLTLVILKAFVIQHEKLICPTVIAFVQANPCGYESSSPACESIDFHYDSAKVGGDIYNREEFEGVLHEKRK